MWGEIISLIMNSGKPSSRRILPSKGKAESIVSTFVPGIGSPMTERRVIYVRLVSSQDLSWDELVESSLVHCAFISRDLSPFKVTK